MINLDGQAIDEQLRQQIAKLKLAIFDVDGVLTDGRLHYGPKGEELKVFHVLDGFGLKELMRAGITVAIISGRDCAALRARLNDLGIEHTYLGQSQKTPALQDLLKVTGINADHCAHMGDDIPDLEVMQQVSISFAPANAVSKVLDQADWVSSTSGGMGAVREVCELILSCKLGAS